MTQDNNPRDYHFDTDIPIPTMEKVYDAQNEEDAVCAWPNCTCSPQVRCSASIDDEEGGPIITAIILSTILMLCGLAYVLKLALFGW